ncbi:type II toxin-antitoxin system RelE/ParE family toxin [Thauera sp. JM12B12]|uniref:type II toxin-antitoxin system RelE/ParE family toxin n=1 Tax=Thauera sp. JM12B12 TaxID=3142262 RepID=UPI0031F3DEF4
MSRPIAVRITRNFERNLDEIEAFLTRAEVPEAFDRLLDELSERVIPMLERHPDIGRDHLALSADSMEAQLKREAVIESLRTLDATGCIREYVLTHYLILYARLPETVHLLAIRHHRQFDFDLGKLDRSY